MNSEDIFGAGWIWNTFSKEAKFGIHSLKSLNLEYLLKRGWIWNKFPKEAEFEDNFVLENTKENISAEETELIIKRLIMLNLEYIFKIYRLNLEIFFLENARELFFFAEEETELIILRGIMLYKALWRVKLLSTMWFKLPFPADVFASMHAKME